MGHTGQQRTGKKSFGKTRPAATKVKKAVQKPSKLKKAVKPGQVLILLAGRFRGSRVVFLKQLASGLLLVTGPYALNGVPLKRVNQRFCIATSTVVDLKGVSAEKITDDRWKRETKKTKKDETSFFAAKKRESTGTPEQHKAEQKKIDEPLVKGLAADMKSYLSSRFSLGARQYPHEMKF
eukprot:TRINITY_DN123386_c0_g1_i1.p1 TRINITY_DN123386_c0_g1~~TRINITY_DN123386_c0_g1_i1.p1  ORF type:complete len:180 (+),score=59.61 TRINITY_DN123386_c0_g1_i1:80-619(+)